MSEDARAVETLRRALDRSQRDWLPDRAVLLSIVIGLIAILLGIVIGIFTASHDKGAGSIPNWAENVLVAISTGALLKVGDAIAALVTLASGRHVERLGNQLAQSAPSSDQPQDVRVVNPPKEPVPVEVP